MEIATTSSSGSIGFTRCIWNPLASDVMRRAEKHFASIPEGTAPSRIRAFEPEQIGERRVVIEREGTTGYVKVVFRAPAATDADPRRLAGG